MSSPALPPRVRVRPVFWLVAALYVAAFPYHPGLRSPNELCRLWQARAIVEYGTLSVNQALVDYGHVGDLAQKDGRLYPSKAPLLSFLAVPVYAALRWVGGGHRYAVPELAYVYWSRLLLTVLPALGLLVLLRRFLAAHVSAAVADAVTVTYALGSLAFGYSLLFMSHQTTAVLLFAAFYALWRCVEGRWRERGYLAAGAAAGAAVAAEYTAVMAVLGLLLYGVLALLGAPGESPGRRWARVGRAAALATLGALPFLGGLMLYHTVCFGGPLESGYTHLNDPGYQPWHLGGFLGIRLPDARAFALSFFSPLRGFFALAPFQLLALPGLWGWFQRSRGQGRERALWWLSAVLLLGYTYFTSSFSYESWGWTTGPRHMTGLVPFLLLPIARWVEQVRALGRGAAAGLCAVSVLVTGAVSLVDYVPDSVSNALFGLALPLYGEGLLPPSVLAAWIPNPASGGLLLGLLVVAAAWVFWTLASSPEGEGEPKPGRWRPLAAGAAAAAAFLLVLGLAGPRGEGDVGAQQHLRSVWLAPPGRVIHFWPRAAR